jgi:putative FmdB family regulatory protein
MPTYEYRCQDCGFEFEEFQSIVAEPLTICPSCSGHITRIISGGGGLIFKGSGFYETDYKRKGSSSQSKSEGEKVVDKTKDE